MRFFSLASAILASAVAVQALATPVLRDISAENVQANPGAVANMLVTKETTLNSTDGIPARYLSEDGKLSDGALPDGSVSTRKRSSTTLPLKFVNKLSSAINAYIVGLDTSGNVVFVLSDGSLVYPSSNGSSTPVKITKKINIPMTSKQTLSMKLPIALISARIYYSVGTLTFAMVKTADGEGLVQPAANNPTDPSAAINWGFVELTLLASGTLYANISYVDFVGLPLGISMGVTGGTTQTAYGVSANAVSNICTSLNAQQVTSSKTKSGGGWPWGKLCMSGTNGKPIRVLSPNSYGSINDLGFWGYWSGYLNEVWTLYSKEYLTIDTQSAAGKVKCKVKNNIMTCAGDNRSYSKPGYRDIWSCNTGPFATKSTDNAVHLAVIPRLCAAFNRSTLMLSGGNVQPSLKSSSYYKDFPTNHYSRFVHANEVDGRGYAFPYDDVNPSSEDASGSVYSTKPSLLTVYIGGPP